MSEYLPYDKMKIDRIVKLEDVLITPDASDIGYFAEVNLSGPDKLREKTKKLLFFSRK